MALSQQMDGFLWLTLWFALNVGVTLFNKAVFKWWDFSFPVTLSMVHMVFSSLGSWALLRMGDYPYQQLSWSEQRPVWLFSVLFCANIVVGNSALRLVNVSLVQVVRSVIPGLTMALSMMVLGKTYSSSYFWVVGLVVAGVAVASYGELEFNLTGFLLTVFVCFLSSLKSVLANKFLVGKLKFHPFELLYRMGLLAAVQMACYVVVFELADVRAWWDEQGARGDDSQRWFLLALTFNGLMAFLLNFSNFQTTKKTSALTVTVAGNVKHIFTIVISVVMFRNPISFLNGLGTCITLIGAALYSFVDFWAKKSTRINSKAAGVANV